MWIPNKLTAVERSVARISRTDDSNSCASFLDAFKLSRRLVISSSRSATSSSSRLTTPSKSRFSFSTSSIFAFNSATSCEDDAWDPVIEESSDRKEARDSAIIRKIALISLFLMVNEHKKKTPTKFIPLCFSFV